MRKFWHHGWNPSTSCSLTQCNQEADEVRVCVPEPWIMCHTSAFMFLWLAVQISYHLYRHLPARGFFFWDMKTIGSRDPSSFGPTSGATGRLKVKAVTDSQIVISGPHSLAPCLHSSLMCAGSRIDLWWVSCGQHNFAAVQTNQRGQSAFCQAIW